MKNIYIICTLLFMCAVLVFPRQQKELDSDVNYDETKVPNYTLPPALISAEGDSITTRDEWLNIRRPEILSLFANLVYGRIPAPESPLETQFIVDEVDSNFMQRQCTRKKVRIRFSNEKGHAEMTVLLFIPNDATKPVPAFMELSFDDNNSAKMNLHLKYPDRLGNGWPLAEILKRGYALVTVYHADLIGHNEVDFDHSIQKLFYKTGQSFPKANEWGVLATIGWSAMRAMDYLETDPDIDQKRVALMGHSKLGKATLWAAAQDQRFALAISAQSGCAGAALWRRRSGETLQKMVTRFPYWLCRNAWKFVNNEADLPVDQHMLIALIAPRPVYVASAVDDHWADPRGEYLSAYYAGPVYRLFDKNVLPALESPEPGQPILDAEIGYHIRQGGHSIADYDWKQFLEFADRHLQKSQSPLQPMAR